MRTGNVENYLYKLSPILVYPLFLSCAHLGRSFTCCAHRANRWPVRQAEELVRKARRWPAGFEFQARPFFSLLLPPRVYLFFNIIIILILRRALLVDTCVPTYFKSVSGDLDGRGDNVNGYAFSHCSSPPLCLRPSDFFLPFPVHPHQ